MTQEFDDSFMADIINSYKDLKQEVAKTPKRKMSRALKRAMPNPVVEWERQRGYR
jgi:hypothetical protein